MLNAKLTHCLAGERIALPTAELTPQASSWVKHSVAERSICFSYLVVLRGTRARRSFFNRTPIYLTAPFKDSSLTLRMTGLTITQKGRADPSPTMFDFAQAKISLRCPFYWKYPHTTGWFSSFHSSLQLLGLTVASQRITISSQLLNIHFPTAVTLLGIITYFKLVHP